MEIQNLSLENLPGEIWKDIFNYERMYQISNKSRAKSLDRTIFHKRHGLLKIKGRILKPSNSHGYPSIALSKNGKIKSFSIHRLVAQAFIPNPLNLPCVLHSNDIRGDDRIENFRWGTSKENTHDAIKNGVMDSRGEKNAVAKLKEIQIIEMRNMWKTNNFTQDDIAEKFNIGRAYVSQIVNNKRWKHL